MAQGFAYLENECSAFPIVAADSEVFAYGSPVTINASGFLAVASSSGEKIYGYCVEDVTVIATNDSGSTAGVFQTQDNTAVGYAPNCIQPTGVYFWADGDAALAQTDIGAYVDVASESAGVVTLDGTAGTSGQFFKVGLLSSINPLAEGDTDKAVVTVAEPQYLGFTQD